MKKKLLFIGLIALSLISISQAQIPRIINYQGMLLDPNEKPVAEGDYPITFNIYDDADVLLWTELHPAVYINDGLFHVLLGTIIPLDIPFDRPCLLGTQIGNDPELAPRMLISSVAYSLNAERVAGYTASSVPSPHQLLALDEHGKFPETALPDDTQAGPYLSKNKSDTTIASTDKDILRIENTGNGRGMTVVSSSSHGIYGKSSSSFAGVEGEGSGAGPGVRGSSIKNFGVVGYSSSLNNAGVYGNNPKGAGVWGNSQSSPGVYGQSTNTWGVKGDSPAGGVLGESTQGIAVHGVSNANDGVVGWTNNPDKSGVYGNSPFGNGVSGRSEAKDGILGVTSSDNTGHAGVHAANEGSGPAIFSEGDLYVTGKSYGDIGPSEGAPFPRPAYNSGWIPVKIEKPGWQVVEIGVDQYLPTSQYDNDNFVVDLNIKSAYRVTSYLVGTNVTYTIQDNNSIKVSFGEYKVYHEITHLRVRVWYIK